MMELEVIGKRRGGWAENVIYIVDLLEIFILVKDLALLVIS